ncbi:hypothetical protein [Agriterribacter sp.]|uniref:hypothetical protein n=1 Tax=Agriterribacter sp. TaxID=2821509 RepID=UPI002C73E476|nr:hypothetical protein [Agriterribacter sp.]HRO45966.1 hypothetical protein [Agriterribacter sp.]HRQ18957.1 hypothetical protein [Agriterribacter sp.]
MKNAPYIYQIIAAIAAVSFFIPFFILMVKRLVKYQAFVWFAVYWMLAGAVNLLFLSETFTGSRLMIVTERVFNLADAPFMLFILYKTVQIETIQGSIKKMLPAFLCAVVLLTVITQLQDFAEILMIGGGLVIIMMYIIWIIVHYIKGIKHHNTEYTLQFIYYALLFEYGISVVTFIFSYMIPDQSNVQDSFLIYHLSIIISISVASYGLFMHKESPEEKKLKVEKKEREAEIKFL